MLTLICSVLAAGAVYGALWHSGFAAKHDVWSIVIAATVILAGQIISMLILRKISMKNNMILQGIMEETQKRIQMKQQQFMRRPLSQKQMIAELEKEQAARIKLDAYPFQKYDTMSGEVVGISENTIQKDQRSLDPEASMTYYRTRLSYDSSTMNHLPENFRLIPGMEVQVEIMTGRRKIITYVTYPLIKALDTAIREP